MNNHEFNKQDELTRRQIMINSARAYLGVSVAPLLGGTLATGAIGATRKASGPGKLAEHVIFLNMTGGMSHIDTFDPKPKNKEVAGPVESIGTNGDFELSQYLPECAKIADRMCVIRSTSSKQGAHDQGQYLLHRSYSPRGTIVHPAIGSWIVRHKDRKNTTLPGFVTVGSNPKNASAGFFGAEFQGVPLGSPNEGLKDSKRPNTVSEDDFNRRLAIADALNKDFAAKFKSPDVKSYDTLYDEATKLMKSEDLKAFEISREPSKTRALYGNDRFGQGCLLARRLVEVGVRFIEVALGGWDTHYDNFTKVEARAAVLDKGFSALIKDLDDKGLLDSTLVVIASEFGRTPHIVTEHSNGRDHHPACFSTVMAGAGIRGGTTYGTSDKEGRRPADNAVSIQDFNATIGYALGIDSQKIIHSPSGRPFRMAGAEKDLGVPLKDIFI